MAKPNLSRKWWDSSRPDDVDGGALAKALAEFEKSQAPTAAAKVGKAIAALLGDLDRKAHRDLRKDLEALQEQAEKAAEGESMEEEGEDDDPAEDRLAAPEVVLAMVKKLRRRTLLFAFALNPKPEECVLLLKAKGNAKNLLKLAKTAAGNNKASCGVAAAAEDDASTLELRLESPLVAGLARMVRKTLKHLKSTLFKKVRVVVDGRVVEESGDAEEEESTEVEAREPPTTIELPTTPEALEDKREAFKLAREEWNRVKLQVEADLEMVKDGARRMYLDDPDQFPKIVKGCQGIDDILDHLDDELRDGLDAYASTPLRQQAKLAQLAGQCAAVLDRYLDYVANNPVMRAIDRREFADVAVHKPVLAALRGLRKALS